MIRKILTAATAMFAMAMFAAPAATAGSFYVRGGDAITMANIYAGGGANISIGTFGGAASINVPAWDFGSGATAIGGNAGFDGQVQTLPGVPVWAAPSININTQGGGAYVTQPYQSWYPTPIYGEKG